MSDTLLAAMAARATRAAAAKTPLSGHSDPHSHADADAHSHSHSHSHPHTHSHRPSSTAASAAVRVGTGPAALRVENLTVSYHHHPAVHHVSCVFDTGSLTAIIGPNGAGKSSLMDALGGRLRPTTGTVQRAEPKRGKLAYLPQQSEIDRSFPLRVLDVVMLGAWRSLGLFGGASASTLRQAREALAAVGLSGFEQRLIGELSVGQFQRVLFARVMLQDAPVILLDEPFNAIDERTTADLMTLVRRWHQEKRTVLAVLHDMELVRAHFPQSLLLARELVAFGDTAEVLSPENLQRARHMAENWDEDAESCQVAA